MLCLIARRLLLLRRRQATRRPRRRGLIVSKSALFLEADSHGDRKREDCEQLTCNRRLADSARLRTLRALSTCGNTCCEHECCARSREFQSAARSQLNEPFLRET